MDQLAIYAERDDHDAVSCPGRPCVAHAPSMHPMEHWPLTYTLNEGMALRTCEHGIQHPDPDSAAWERVDGKCPADRHTCDGCCAIANP